jgi:hypothetical protein
MDKKKVVDLLRTSKEDYKKYRESHNVSFFRDASQKLYEAMLNYGEWVYGARYTNLGQFTEDFYSDKKRLPISESERKDFVMSVWQMHEFAYHGPEEPLSMKEYENRYNNIYGKLHFLLEHSKKESKKLVKV